MEFLLGNQLVIIFLCIGSTIADIPDCNYFDTVNLTDSSQFPNGSYIYDSLLIPKEMTGEYNCETLEDGKCVAVPKHIRGCACKLRDCLRFCWHEDMQPDEEVSNVTIILDDGTEKVRHISDSFIIQRDLPEPCSGSVHVDANEEDAWELFENGSDIIIADAIISKSDYCLQPHRFDENGVTKLRLVPRICRVEFEKTGNTVIAILRILSIIGFIVTVFIYLWIPELQNLQALCIVCYMICLTIAFFLLSIDVPLIGIRNWKWLCLFCGYLGYFVVMAAFFWLTVISFELWNSIRSSTFTNNRRKDRNRFIKYILYTSGLAFLFTAIVIIIDIAFNSPDLSKLAWTPGVGLYSCWIKTNDSSAWIYYYGPISLLLMCNVIMFLQTIKNLFEIMTELRQTSRKIRRRLYLINQTFGLMLRLFVIMGITWTFEIFSYLAQNLSIFEIICQIFNYVNCSHGIIIFALFVLKGSVLRLISERIWGTAADENADTKKNDVVEEERTSKAKDLLPRILH